MCCGKVKQSHSGWDVNACGAYSINFSLADILSTTCTTKSEIRDSIYNEIQFDPVPPGLKAGYSDPRKIADHINGCTFAKASLYVHGGVPTVGDPGMQGFWKAAGFKKTEYKSGDVTNYLNVSTGKKSANNAICVLFWRQSSAVGMHFVVAKKTSAGVQICDPYHGHWYASGKADLEAFKAIETYRGNFVIYTGIGVLVQAGT